MSKKDRLHPPFIGEKLFRLILPASEKHALIGDYEELYKNLAQKRGRNIAGLWYWIQILTTILSTIKDSTKWSLTMIRNYLKIALRNLNRYKGFSFINIFGLAIGIACSILIFLWIIYQRSYDTFHVNANRIYRIAVKGSIGNTSIHYSATPAILAGKLKDIFPEVEQTVRMRRFDSAVPVSYQDKSFNQMNIFAVDSSFFNVFTCSILQGDVKTVLNKPNTAVITREMADKYFGVEDPLGNSLTLFGESDYLITGVVEPFPSHSHFHFDFLISATSFEFSRNTDWLQSFFRTYIVLQKDATPEKLELKFPDFIKDNVFFYNQFEQGGYEEWAGKENFWEYYLQPLADIHLHSHLKGEYEPSGNGTYVSFFSFAAIFILLIACINFMNLMTARSSLRAKEIGVRKVVGSTQFQLIRQYLTETILFSFIALFFGLILVQWFLPYFSNFSGCELSISYFKNLFVLLGLIVFGFMVGCVSGCYPSFYLSSLKPVLVIKGNLQEGLKNSWLRNGLVVFQFSISIILVIGTCVVYKQMKYIQNTNPGFEKEQVVVIQNARDLGIQKEPFKESLLQNPSIVSAAASHTLPGRHFYNMLFMPEGSEPITLNVCYCDEDLLETLQMKIVAGRFFSNDFITDRQAIILNETAVQILGWEHPIGKTIRGRDDRIVIGVAKDFYFESMHENIRPVAFLLFPGSNYISIRIQPDDLANTIGFIHKTWNQFLPGQPFEYSFLDEDYDSIYKNEQQLGRLFTLFSLLALFIASLGLLGLTSFMIQQRVKEIGIRKVLGASNSKIIFTLSKTFYQLIFISNLISFPVAWYFMHKWLQTFAYRTNFGFSIFILGSLLTFFIAFITVSYQSVRAANTNPVEALYYE